MLISLYNYVSGLPHTVKKDDILNTLDNIFNNIESDIIPTISEMVENGKIKAIDKNKDLKIITNSRILKASDNKDLLNKIKKVFEEILKEKNNLTKIADKELPRLIASNSISAKDAAILKVINDIGSMSLFIVDLCYYILIDGDETNYPKIKLKQIKEGLPTFSNLLKVYSKDFSKLVEALPKISNQIINIDSDDTGMLETLLAKKGKLVNLPVARGFINNPFYHIRMWYVDREIEKYESLKDKKKLVELRLMELKLKERNENDPKLKGQIEYYEDRLNSIEYKIKEIEDN